MTPTRILLAGNAITAEILIDYLRQDPRYEVLGLTVDDAFADEGGIAGFRTVGLTGVTEAFAPDTHKVIMAMGYNDLNRTRENVFLRLRELGYEVETYVHPGAHVHTDLQLGEGCVILPGAVVEPRVSVGANTMVWSNVTLAHHCSVEQNCWVAAGTVISGKARIGRNTFVGVGATVVNEVTVGEFNIVGAGALITRDTKPHSVHLARSAETFRFGAEDYVKHFGI